MATSVGYLRIAADKHYFSDVMTAAVIGSIVGVGIPLLFHAPSSREPASASATVQALPTSPLQPAFTISGRF
jgi:membrane-associated phospholipid phosphatase